MSFLRYFGYTVGAALLSAALGGVFGAVVAVVSPDFIWSTFAPPEAGSVVRYAASMGMIWGLFMGAGVMLASLLISALNHLAGAIRSRKDHPDAR